MRTIIHLRYFAQLFFECEMSEQIVDRTKEHILCSICCPTCRRLSDNVIELGRSVKATDQNMELSYCMLET